MIEYLKSLNWSNLSIFPIIFLVLGAIGAVIERVMHHQKENKELKDLMERINLEHEKKKREIIEKNPPISNNKEDILAELNRFNKFD